VYGDLFRTGDLICPGVFSVQVTFIYFLRTGDPICKGNLIGMGDPTCKGDLLCMGNLIHIGDPIHMDGNLQWGIRIWPPLWMMFITMLSRPSNSLNGTIQLLHHLITTVHQLVLLRCPILLSSSMFSPHLLCPRSGMEVCRHRLRWFLTFLS
jgi:hypothetical protein